VTEFPYAKDYQLALQNPARVFTRAGMQQARFSQDSWGLPEALAGSSAVVFHATIGADSYALRCYTRKEASSRERYEAFDSYVGSHQLTDHVASVAWHEDAVRVKGGSWPVLQMEWIDGRILDEYVGHLVETSNTDALARLADRWRELIRRLQDARFAHGDLQHGNVIIDQRGGLRLVDFDSVWIPPLEGHPPPTETGHENYQHPGRTVSVGWGPWVDTFSGLVIYLSLVALARDPGLWMPLHNGENLLFAREDFSAPFETNAWKHLDRIIDPDVRSLVYKLRECCAPDWVAAGSLEKTLEQPWWKQSGAVAAGGGAQPETAGQPGAASRPGEAAQPPAWQWGRSVSRPSPGQPLPPPPAPKAPATRTVTPGGVWQPPVGQPRWEPPAGQPHGQGMRGKKLEAGNWWQQLPSAPGPMPPPADRAKPRSKTIAGSICLVLGLIVLIGFLAAHLVAVAVLFGVALGGAGLRLIASDAASSRGPKPSGKT